MRREKIQKPWGGYERFTLNESSTVKILTIKRGQALSLQTHEKRTEFWKVIRGEPSIQIGNSVIKAMPGDEFTIHEREAHRISAPDTKVEILEIAFGDFDENDIVRLEDRYGRVKK